MSPAPSNRKPSIPTDEDVPRTPVHQSPPASGHSQRSNHSNNNVVELPPSPARTSHKSSNTALGLIPIPPPTAPAALSSPNPATAAPTTDSTSTRLLKIVQDPAQRRKFHSYLKSRFSEENLEFYVDVKKYHLAWESSQWDQENGLGQTIGQGANVMQLAFHIYGQYLRETSHKAVNVPRELVQHVEERLFPNDSFAKTMPMDLFDSIQQHCFGLMAHGNVNDFLRYLSAEEEARKKHLGELESLEDDRSQSTPVVSHNRMVSLEALGVTNRMALESRSRSHERNHERNPSTSSMSSTSTMSEQAWNPTSRSSSEDALPRPKTARGSTRDADRDDDPDSDDTKKSSQSWQSRQYERQFSEKLDRPYVEREEYQPRITHYDKPPWQTSPKIQPQYSQGPPQAYHQAPTQSYTHPSQPSSYSTQPSSFSVHPSSYSSHDLYPRTPFSASSDYRRPSTSSNFPEEYDDRDQYRDPRRQVGQETFAGALARRLRSKSSAGREKERPAPEQEMYRPQTSKTEDFSLSTPSLLLRRTTTKKSKEEKLREKEEKKRLKELRKEEPPLPPTDFVNLFAPALHPSVTVKPKLSSTAKPVMHIASRNDPGRGPHGQGAPFSDGMTGITPWTASTASPHTRTNSMSFRFSRDKKTDSVLLPDSPITSTQRRNESLSSSSRPQHRYTDSNSSYSSIGTPTSGNTGPRQIKVFNVLTGESKTVNM